MSELKFEDCRELAEHYDNAVDYAKRHKEEWTIDCDDDEWQRRYEGYLREQSKKQVIE